MKIAHTAADNSFNSQNSIQQIYTQQIVHIWRKESTPTFFGSCIVFSHLQGVSLHEDILSFPIQLSHM